MMCLKFSLISLLESASLTVVFKAGARLQPAMGRLWLRTWFTKMDLIRIDVTKKMEALVWGPSYKFCMGDHWGKIF